MEFNRNGLRKIDFTKVLIYFSQSGIHSFALIDEYFFKCFLASAIHDSPTNFRLNEPGKIIFRNFILHKLNNWYDLLVNFFGLFNTYGPEYKTEVLQVLHLLEYEKRHFHLLWNTNR